MARLPGADLPPVTHEDRDLLIRSIRDRVLDLVGPTYILDRNYHFVDWNPSFEEIIARPLKLVRGRHAESFVLGLSNVDEVLSHSLDTFVRSAPPQVDTELLHLRTPEYGTITFRKIAAQIPDDTGAIHGWSVHLVMLDSEDNAKLWSAIVRRLEREVTWSKYAVVYDSLLLNFDDYLNLLDTVAKQVAGARRCVDLGAGTGNSTFALLDKDPACGVWAVESNEIMIRQLRRKVDARNAGQVRVVKEDIHSMPGFADASFDAATMVNTLYALDDPAACLAEIHRVLKPEAVLALCTPHTLTDVDRLFERMREVLTAKGLFDSLAEAYHAARERHAAIDSQIHRFTIEDVRELIESCGFVVECVTSAYVDAVVVIRARKA